MSPPTLQKVVNRRGVVVWILTYAGMTRYFGRDWLAQSAYEQALVMYPSGGGAQNRPA